MHRPDLAAELLARWPAVLGLLLGVVLVITGATAMAWPEAEAEESSLDPTVAALPLHDADDPTPAGWTHEVDAGESIEDVAAAYGRDVESLRLVNNLAPGAAVEPGASLVVPDRRVEVLDLDQAVTRDDHIVDQLELASERHDLDPLLVKAVAWVESSFRPAVRSWAGAIGVMQLLPSTVDVAGDLVGRPLDPLDVADNIEGGAVYLAYLVDITDDVRLALASYHEGWGRVRAQGPSLASVDYVDRVMTARAAFAVAQGTG